MITMLMQKIKWMRAMHMQIGKVKKKNQTKAPITNVHKHIKVFDNFFIYTHIKKLTTIETGILQIYFFVLVQ